MTQELRERVAEAACNAANGDGCWEETPCLPREAIWYPIADAAIDLVLEEAAKVADETASYDDILQKSAECRTTGQRIAAAIRALKKKTPLNNDQG